MGNRRLGAQRLASMMKRGADGLDSSYQAGAGIKDAIVSHKIIKRGGIIETQILVDLQGKAGSIIHSPDATDDAIGATTDASDEAAALAGAIAGCHLLKWENDVHGDLFEAEIIVVEVPNGTEASHVRVSFATFAAGNKLGSVISATSGLALVDKGGSSPAALAAGDRFIFPTADDDLDNANPNEVPFAAVADADGLGLYLSCGDDNPGHQYTQGKLLIMLRGYDTQWGF